MPGISPAYRGIVQVDGYAAYRSGSPIRAATTPADARVLLVPLPAEVLRDRQGRPRADRRGGAQAHRRTIRDRSRDPRQERRGPPRGARRPVPPLVEDLRPWLETSSPACPRKSQARGGDPIHAEALGRARRASSTTAASRSTPTPSSAQSGRSRSTERMPSSPAPTAAASTGPASPSLIETCKLNAVDPHAYLTDILERIVNGHPQSRIDELMPWIYAQ